MTTTDTAHEHMFPLKTPGVFGDYGPCECGLTYEQALAGSDLDAEESRAEFARRMEARDYPSPDDRYDGDELAEAFAAGMQAGRNLAGPLERERNILRGQLEHAELTITDYLNAKTALRAGFDRLRVLLNEASSDRDRLRAVLTGIALGTAGDPSVAADEALTASRERAGAGPRATPDAKAAIEEAVRRLDFPALLAAEITDAFPVPVQGEDIPLAAIFDGTHPRYLECDELRALYAGHPAVKRVIDTAAGIEGRRATETDGERFGRTCPAPEPVNASTDLSVPFPDRL